MLELRFRHWSHLAAGLLARHASFNLLNCQRTTTLRIADFQFRISAIRNSQFGRGADRDRTDDLLVANQALSQLSYSPEIIINCQFSIDNIQLFGRLHFRARPGGPEWS